MKGHPRSGLDPKAICKLPPAGLAERRAWIAAEILPHARSSERGLDWIEFHFDDTPELERQLDQLVALEAQCCGEIEFSHAREASQSDAPSLRRLEIRGIDPSAAIFLAGADPLPGSSEPLPAKGRLRRGAEAAGLGVAGSLLVCCVLPIGVATLLGVSAATHFRFLDQPWALGASALGFGVLYWRWRARKLTKPGSSAGCATC